MFSRLPDLHRRVRKGAGLPKVEVPRKEFLELLSKAGVDRNEARLQANLSIAFGSSVRIGDRLVKIKA